MKASTIATKYPALAEVADKLTTYRPSILEDINDLLGRGYIRPQNESGRGRWRHLEDHRSEIQEALDVCGIEVVKFNDAPRRGRTGDLWVLKGRWVAVVMDNGEAGYHAVGEFYNTRALVFGKYSSAPMVDYVKAHAMEVAHV